MKVQEVLNCAFPSWYESFKHLTEQSIVIPLPQNILDYLHADGVVLPQSSTHGLYTKSSNLAMDGDEDDKDIRDDELMNMYDDDWSVPSSDASESQPPDLKNFDNDLKEAISTLGGRVFPKLNWSSPKDASWISFDRTLMCACPSDVYLLLKSSEFIAHDLDQPFIDCDCDSKGTTVSYCLVLRKWNPPAPAAEFRCFVRQKKLIGVCQRNIEKFYPSIQLEKDSIVEDICTFFSKHIQEKFINHSYIFDVVRTEKEAVSLIDFNPWGPVTDGLMFEWKELNEGLHQDLEAQTPEFRCVLTEGGVKSSSYSQYAVPLDIVDMPQGQNPFKLMEMMEQNPDDDDSSCEGDE